MCKKWNLLNVGWKNTKFHSLAIIDRNSVVLNENSHRRTHTTKTRAKTSTKTIRIGRKNTCFVRSVMKSMTSSIFFFLLSTSNIRKPTKAITSGWNVFFYKKEKKDIEKNVVFCLQNRSLYIFFFLAASALKQFFEILFSPFLFCYCLSYFLSVSLSVN